MHPDPLKKQAASTGMNTDEPRFLPRWWKTGLFSMGTMLAGFVCLVLSGFEFGVMLVVGLLLVIGAMGLQMWGIHHSPEARRVDRRYAREFFVAMVGYMLIMTLVWPQIDHVGSVWLKVVIALLPMIPTLFAARAIARRIRDSDELQRRVQLEAAAIAGLVVGMFTFCIGFLQVAGVLPAFKGDMFLVWPLMCGVWGVAFWWAKRRYR